MVRVATKPAEAPAPTAADLFEPRLRRWLFSAPVSELRRQTGIARSTLHDWLRGVAHPKGIVRWALAQYLERWVEEQASRPVVKPNPAKVEVPRWPQRY